ncbi:MAG: hypothetical protein B9S32_13810 [Verrucomicrobia bacterium Tous-C9LFEB]|nr:MAG: hypothetical protein B9S32_13810 [Verrucomicrobia bacterium Tous-C9LFEB]
MKTIFSNITATPRFRSTVQPATLRLWNRGGATIPNFNLWTVKELRAELTRLQLRGRSKAKRKADLITLLTRYAEKMVLKKGVGITGTL